jgi:hypothetical protein
MLNVSRNMYLRLKYSNYYITEASHTIDRCSKFESHNFKLYVVSNFVYFSNLGGTHPLTNPEGNIILLQDWQDRRTLTKTVILEWYFLSLFEITHHDNEVSPCRDYSGVARPSLGSSGSQPAATFENAGRGKNNENEKNCLVLSLWPSHLKPFILH